MMPLEESIQEIQVLKTIEGGRVNFEKKFVNWSTPIKPDLTYK